MAPKKSQRSSAPAKPPAAPADKKGSKATAAPAAAAPSKKAASMGGKMKAVGSEDNLADMDDSPSTPLNTSSRIKAWVKISGGTPSGISAEDSMSVRSEVSPDGEGASVVSFDGTSKKLEKAIVDGVAGVDQPISSMEGDLITPLVDAAVDDLHALKVGVLLCYGEEGSGRSESLVGSDNLVHATASRMIAQAPAGHVVHCSATLIAMELLFDLFEPSSELTIDETQFSGLHLNGGAWKTLGSASDVAPLLATVKANREVVTQKLELGRSHRACLVVALRVAPAEGTIYGNIVYLVELASPPMLRASGVSGLAIEEFCSINTSLKTLTKCFTAMGSKKKAATPPLRESRLTHLLGNALGDEGAAPVHCLVYVPARRAKRGEAGAAIVWAGKATQAKLKKGVYASASSKALVSQLQGVVASLEEPSKDMEAEMREQMEPPADAISSLKAAVNGKKAMLSEVEQEVMTQKQKVDAVLAKNAEAAKTRAAEHEEIKAAITDLREQIDGVKSGEQLQKAMNTLKTQITEEKAAMRKQVGDMEERLATAKSKLVDNEKANTRVGGGAPAQCTALFESGLAYSKQGKNKYASLMFMSSVKLMESLGLGRSAHVVKPVSALADLYSTEGMDEEAIALYKQAYSIEKDATGADSPELARHLQKLGQAYEKQGKMEAATLTLEEAGSVLEHALGPDHPEVMALREKLAALVEPEPEPEEEEEEEPEPEPEPEAATGGAESAAASPEKKDEEGGKKKPQPKAKGKKGEKGSKGDAESKDAQLEAATKPAKAGAKPKAGAKKGAKAKKGAGDSADPTEPIDVSVLSKPHHTKNSISTNETNEINVQKFSSQRMKARLEARNRRLAEEGRELSLGMAPSLPDVGEDVSEPTNYEVDPLLGDVLSKKREMFRERMARRKAAEGGEGDAKEAGGAHNDEREEEAYGEEDDSADESDADLDEDGLGDGGSNEIVMIESSVIEITAAAHAAALREDWGEVLDASAQLEHLLARAKGKVSACATAARVLLNTGLKYASGFSDEPRMRSILGCLMLVEWCVPTCPDAFRQAVAGDRWVRKLVDLCRKDTTDQQLVRNTVMQLVANWSSWYAGTINGFEKASEMLQEMQFEMPPAAARDSDLGGKAATSPGGMGASGTLAVPGLQLQLQLPLASVQPQHLGNLATETQVSRPPDRLALELAPSSVLSAPAGVAFLGLLCPSRLESDCVADCVPDCVRPLPARAGQGGARARHHARGRATARGMPLQSLEADEDDD